MEFNNCMGQAHWIKPAAYPQIKDRIYYRIISRDSNMPLLETTVHIDILDMAMAFFVLINSDETGFISMAVCERMADYWEVTAEEIREQAERNTPILFPKKIRSLRDMVTELCQANGDSTAVGAIQGYPQGKITPYVLTNAYGIYGFSAVFYKGVLEGFADCVGSSLFVLPSSTHEALLIPESDGCNPNELRKMVYEVNRVYVERKDFLSDNIYYYDREKGRLQIEE